MKSRWKEERRKFFKDTDVELEEVERRRIGWFGKVVREDREIQRKERWKMINKSQYNRWYKEIKGEGIPGYLRKGWKEEEQVEEGSKV